MAGDTGQDFETWTATNPPRRTVPYALDSQANGGDNPTVCSPSSGFTDTECPCTDWAHRKRPDLPCYGPAKDWVWQASAAGYAVGSRPQEGSIVVFQPEVPGVDETDGHVAYVEEVYSSSSFRVSEMGWGKTPCRVNYREPYTEPGVEFIYISGAAILEFTTRLSGPPVDNQSADVEVHVFQAGTDDLVFHDIVTTDSYGNYSGLTISGVTPGTCEIYVKPAGYLRRGATVALSAGANYVDFSAGGHEKLTAGDIDVYGGDNTVNGLDFGKWCIDWCPIGDCPDSIADFNRDGVINAIDGVFIFTSWFEEGDGCTSFRSWSGTGFDDRETGPQRTSIGHTAVEERVGVVIHSSSAPAVGGTIDVDVRIDGNNIPLDAIDVIIDYDDCIFVVQDVAPGSAFPYISYDGNTTSGIVRISGDVGAGSSYCHDGWENLATVTFTVVASPRSGVTGMETIVIVDTEDPTTAETADSNAVEHGTALDIIGETDFDIIFFTGSPVRPYSAITLTEPFPNSFLNENLIDISAEVAGMCGYAYAAVFDYRNSGDGNQWRQIAYDENRLDGWNALWDVSDLPDGVSGVPS